MMIKNRNCYKPVKDLDALREINLFEEDNKDMRCRYCDKICGHSRDRTRIEFCGCDEAKNHLLTKWGYSEEDFKGNYPLKDKKDCKVGIGG